MTPKARPGAARADSTWRKSPGELHHGRAPGMPGPDLAAEYPACECNGGLADAVEVWRVWLDEQPGEHLAAFQALLSVDEARRARRFHHERDCRRFVVGRAVLRILLARQLGAAPGEIEFVYGVNGKPAVLQSAGPRPALRFNVSHSDGLAVYAFTRAGEVGVDVERIRELPDWDRIAAVAFPPSERAHLQACPPGECAEQFFHAWARREAVLKAQGSGLGEEAADAGRQDDLNTQLGFNVHSLDLAPGFAAALAAPPAVREPHGVRQWSKVPGAAGVHGLTSMAKQS